MSTETKEVQSESEEFRPFRLGRFSVLAPLGQGGMARVFLAEYRGVGGFARRVVIKQIHEQHAANDRFVKMFVDEANIASHLMHANVVQVLDLQQEAQNLFMVLEYVDGLDLNALFNALVNVNQRLPLPVALYVVQQTLQGLMHAHAAVGPDGSPLNLIHRDITPGNVLLGRHAQVKLSDFGVARAVGRMTQTVVGEVKGKYSYMAPEVMQGDAYDQRSDVFGMGVVLWEALTTRPLFRGKSDFHVMEAVLRGPIYPPSTFNPEVRPDLDAVVMQALERPVDRRYQSAHAFKRALSPFVTAIDGDAAETQLEELVTRFAPLGYIPSPSAPLSEAVGFASVPHTNPSQAGTAPASNPEARRAASAPQTPEPKSADQQWLDDGPGFTPDRTLDASSMELGASARPTNGNGGVAPAQPAPAPPLQPPAAGEPGFHAVMGADRANLGPLSTRSLLTLLQRTDGLATDRVGVTPQALLPLVEAGRLLMLDHLVKPPSPAVPPSMGGAMKDVGAVRLLLTLAGQRATGVLVISAPAGFMAVFAADGCLHYTFLADPTHHLLSLFVTHQPNGVGLLPQIVSVVLRDRMALPRVMAKVAQLSGSRITAAVAALSRERFVHGLQWEGATFAFHPGIAAPYELTPPKESLLSVLPLAVSRVLSPRDVANQAGKLLDRPLSLDAVDPSMVSDLGLQKELESLRGALAGSPTLRSGLSRVCQAGSPEEQRLHVALVVLQQCGALRDR